MDSNIYLQISDKISQFYPSQIKELPLKLAAPFLNSSQNFIEDISLFIKEAEKIIKLKILNKNLTYTELINSFYSVLFKNKKTNTEINNSVELVNCLTDLLLSFNKDCFNSPIWNLANICFILESSAHFNLCQNRSEQHIKLASHKAAINIINNIYNIEEIDAYLITGFLRSAWLLSQKTEGIKDLENETLATTTKPVYRFILENREIIINKENAGSIFMIDSGKPSL